MTTKEKNAKQKKAALKFEPTGRGNVLLQGDGFFVSFRGNTQQLSQPAFGMPLPLVDALMQGDDKGKGETALHDGKQYLILNGDFRAEYLKAAKRGLAACVAVYESHRATHRSQWSDDAR